MPTRLHRLVPLLGGALLLLAAAEATSAQDLHPSRRPSPVGIAKTFVGDVYVKVTYGRPYMRGRAVFGDPSDGNAYLVPFGQTWRTGANEATEITLTGPLEVGGQRLEAGTFSIFTVPGPTRWEVRFHPGLGMDGTGRLGADGAFAEAYDPALDRLVLEAAVSHLDEAVDQFTIAFEAVGEGAHLVMRWEQTEVRVPIEPVAGRP